MVARLWTVDIVFSFTIAPQFRIECYRPLKRYHCGCDTTSAGVIDPGYTINANALIFLARSTAC